ncbi:MAG: cell division protein FtsQ/DivIB [Pseudomonadota bacterium]
MARRIDMETSTELSKNPGRHPLVYIFGILGFLTFLGLGYFFQLINDPQKFPITKIAVDGEFINLKHTDVESLVSEAVVGGFFSLDVDFLQTKMGNNPWIEAVSVRRIWPDSIRVSIREQEPVALWGEHALLNEDADIFAPSRLSPQQHLIKLDGPIGTETLVLAKYRELKSFFNELGIELTKLRMNERRSWQLKTKGGVVINLGRGDLGAKLARFKTAYEGALTEEWARVSVIDLRYTNGLTVRYFVDSPPVVTAPTVGNQQG